MLQVILQSLVGLALMVLGIDKIRPSFVEKHRWGYHYSFGVLGALFIALAAWQYLDQETKDRENTKQLREIKEAQLIESKKQDAIFVAIAANPSMPNEIKTRAIEANDGFQKLNAKIATLESIKSSLDNTSALLEIQRTEAENKRLKAEVETIGNCSPVFDCAIRSLQDQLLKMSSEIHSDVVSNYRSIPERISPDSGKQICEIKVSGGVNWDFMISVNTRRSEIDRGDPPYLSISSGEINLEIDPENENGRVVTIVQGGGRDAIHDTGPMNDYHPVIDKAVGYLIAATSEFNEKQTKAPQTH